MPPKLAESHQPYKAYDSILLTIQPLIPSTIHQQKIFRGSMTVLVHHLGPWLPIMPLDTPGPLLDHCCIQSLGVGPRRWFRVDQGGPQWSRVVQEAPEGKSNFLTFLLMGWGAYH